MNLNMYQNISINKTLLKIVGPIPTIYWAELMSVLPKVLKKETYTDEGYFKIDRKYITEQLNLNLVDQYNCDAILSNLGVLEYSNSDRDLIRVDPELMTSIIINEDLDKLYAAIERAKLTTNMKNDSKLVAAKKERELAAEEKRKQKEEAIKMKEELARIKAENFKNELVEYIKTYYETEPNLLELYSCWIEAVLARKNFITKAQINLFCRALNEYNLDIPNRTNFLKIAANTGYSEFDYVLKRYESQYGTIVKTVSTTNSVLKEF